MYLLVPHVCEYAEWEVLVWGWMIQMFWKLFNNAEYSNCESFVIFYNEPEFLHLKLEKTKNIIKCNFRPWKNILLVDEESIVGVSKILSKYFLPVMSKSKLRCCVLGTGDLQGMETFYSNVTTYLSPWS